MLSYSYMLRNIFFLNACIPIGYYIITHFTIWWKNFKVVFWIKNIVLAYSSENFLIFVNYKTCLFLNLLQHFGRCWSVLEPNKISCCNLHPSDFGQTNSIKDGHCISGESSGKVQPENLVKLFHSLLSLHLVRICVVQ